MKKIFLLISLLSMTLQLRAQGQYDKCYFGNAGIDFGGLFPTALTDSEMETFETAVSMCSPQGTLLFYSNGGNSPTAPGVNGAVWNANHEIMENGVLGDSSGCISSYQGAVAFPFVSTSDKTGSNMYYIFMRDCAESSFSSPDYNSGLTFCEIDMNKNNGLGKVVTKNNVVVPFEMNNSVKTNQEPVTALLHENNQDWWIFSYNNDSLYSLQVTQNTVGQYRSYFEGEGALVFSPDRKMLLAGEELYDFDALTGDLSHVVTLPSGRYAFSPNGQLLYGMNQELTQYDVSSSNILTTAITIATGLNYSNLYLAPDARIYLFKHDVSYLPGYIDCPNATGVNCGFSLYPIDLNGRNAEGGFTNIPANYLYKDNYNCNLQVEKLKSSTEQIQFYPNPATQNLNVQYHGSKELIDYSIYSISGRHMFNGKLLDNSAILDVSHWEQGVYFFKSKGMTRKFIVSP